MERVRGYRYWLYTRELKATASYKLHETKVKCTAQFSTFTTESKQTIIVLCKWFGYYGDGIQYNVKKDVNGHRLVYPVYPGA